MSFLREHIYVIYVCENTRAETERILVEARDVR